VSEGWADGASVVSGDADGEAHDVGAEVAGRVGATVASAEGEVSTAGESDGVAVGLAEIGTGADGDAAGTAVQGSVPGLAGWCGTTAG